MRAVSQFVRLGLGKGKVNSLLVIFAASFALAIPAAAQFHGGPPTTTQIGGHTLGPPPLATSMAARSTPNALPSVTSIPNYGYHYHYGAYYNGYYGNRGHGYRNGGYGYGYVIPYYYPVDDSAYGYDYVGGGAGPDMYSGPPIGPNDSIQHLVVEQPPANPYSGDYATPMPEAYVPPQMQPPAPPPPDAKPNEPTVLVFRNGHQQEVRNYAVMGDTVWVFDQGSKKIALADLDLPATIKANDDRGMEFKLPPTPKKKTPTLPQTTTPAPNKDAPANIATLAE